MYSKTDLSKWLISYQRREVKSKIFPMDCIRNNYERIYQSYDSSTESEVNRNKVVHQEQGIHFRKNIEYRRDVPLRGFIFCQMLQCFMTSAKYSCGVFVYL